MPTDNSTKTIAYGNDPTFRMVGTRMPKFPAGSLSRLALRHQVNRVLAERGIDVRIVDARNATERTTLGDSYLVDRLKRHVILRDHVDLHEFAQEIGVSSAAESGSC